MVANATAASFASSPLFTARESSLASFLSSFSSGYSPSQVRAGIDKVVTGESYPQYPLILSRSITRSLVSPDNGTMIVVYNFAVPPTDKMIAAFRADISGSSVPSLGTYYVTGGAVLTSDITKVFGPVIGVTIVPGVLASLAIVGLLLLAPLAAIIPVLVGGIAIAIGLPVIYYGVVDVGHGTLTFLTPSLTVLLVLGLAVDYSVLQLRRTREERIKGASTEESVAISMRWAGQAVLTAGVTVVVAYVVMAVANVPLFSGVGTAIAIAVSILIAAALTLLPSLELALKDRLFWPGLKIQKKRASSRRYSRLRRMGERTLRRKFAVVVVVIRARGRRLLRHSEHAERGRHPQALPRLPEQPRTDRPHRQPGQLDDRPSDNRGHDHDSDPLRMRPVQPDADEAAGRDQLGSGLGRAGSSRSPGRRGPTARRSTTRGSCSSPSLSSRSTLPGCSPTSALNNETAQIPGRPAERRAEPGGDQTPSSR